MDLDQLMKTYGDNLLRLCVLYLKDYALAEDAVQETFIRAWNNRAAFRQEASFKTWITRIAINVCKSYLRTSWSRVLFFDAPSEGLCGTEAPMAPDDTLIKAVTALPKKYREVILLYYYQELSVNEIASVLNEKASTVGVRLKRGRDRLRPILKGWYYDE